MAQNPFQLVRPHPQCAVDRVKHAAGTGERMPVRLKDIAQELGVSTVTVSKVLRGSPDVGDLTRARVSATHEGAELSAQHAGARVDQRAVAGGRACSA